MEMQLLRYHPMLRGVTVRHYAMRFALRKRQDNESLTNIMPKTSSMLTTKVRMNKLHDHTSTSRLHCETITWH